MNADGTATAARAYRPLAVALVVLSTAAASGAVWFAAQDGAVAGAVTALKGTGTLPVTTAIGAVVVVRRPRNVVGWLLASFGALAAVVAFAGSYAEHGLVVADEAPPSALWAAWLSNWLMVVPIVLFLLHLPLRFPDGRLLSPRWRPVSGLATTLAIVAVVTGALRPIPLGVIEGGEVANPAGVTGLEPALAAVDVVADLLFAGLVVAVVASAVLRYRRSRGVARQQMRWFTTGLVVSVSAIPVAQLGVPVVSTVAAGTVGLALPVAIGVAVLRYRLYDLGHLLNRTAVYAIVTALLVGFYASSVLALPALVRPIGSDSDLVVAGSTLAAAAAFGPLRRRVQRLVDRRFDRGRYDLERTVEDFAHRLRHEVDLTSITDDVADVVRTTVHPVGLSVWFRPRAT